MVGAVNIISYVNIYNFIIIIYYWMCALAFLSIWSEFVSEYKVVGVVVLLLIIDIKSLSDV